MTRFPTATHVQRPDHRARNRNQKLNAQLQRAPAPKLRSTAIPHGATIARVHEPSPPPPPPVQEPVFEEVKPLSDTEETATPDQFNDLGVRKYDLPALFNRIRNHFRRPTTNNPRLVAYLAAGGVHGLRPMRYEKRVARNRSSRSQSCCSLFCSASCGSFCTIVE